MKYSEIIREIDEVMQYLKTHNKNYTKKQYCLILYLQDLIHKLHTLNIK